MKATTESTRNLLVFRRRARTRERFVNTMEEAKDTAAEQKILKGLKGKGGA